MVAPKLASMLRAAWLGSHAPDGIARMGFADLMRLWWRRTPLIWHARRNDEMIVGVLLRALGWPLRLVFTSAAQRHHSWITRWLIRRMDAVIATSDISASFLKRESVVVMHGVDTDAYAPPADRAAAFAASGLPGRYAIGWFGRVRAQKGSDVFVEAMCRLLPRYPDFTAVMVGAIVPEQQAFASELKKRIEAAGLQSRIVIMGELAIEEVQRWYQRLTIYAFTSRNEGFGLTLIEAMAAGSALVASRAGAAERVVEDGVTGVLTPPGDADALVAALEPLMRDPALAAAMGQRARARVREKFSLDAEANAIAKVYRRPIGASLNDGMSSAMKKILFLCTGNYYRSRYAEEIFNHIAEQRGLAWRAFSRGAAERGSPDNVGVRCPDLPAKPSR